MMHHPTTTETITGPAPRRDGDSGEPGEQIDLVTLAELSQLRTAPPERT